LLEQPDINIDITTQDGFTANDFILKIISCHAESMYAFENAKKIEKLLNDHAAKIRTRSLYNSRKIITQSTCVIL